MNLKHYFLVVIFTTVGLLFLLYGFSFSLIRFSYNIVVGLLLGSIFYLVNNKLIKEKLKEKRFGLTKKIIIYFFSIFIVSYLSIHILKIVFDFFYFNQLSFYWLENPFKSSLCLSFLITPINCFVLLYQEKLKLEKFNKKLLINQERNRLAGELHDDIGFNLTTAIVQLNLAQKTIEKDKLDCSLKSIKTAQSQMKHALENIRLKVRLINNDFDFKDECTSLIRNFEKITNIKIDCKIEDLNNLGESRKILIYRALKEGINNGIRHGNASYFKFNLITDKKELLFVLKNNGKHDFNQIKKGFGLKNMEEKVNKIGGRLKTYIDNDEFFVLKFYIYLD